MIVYCNNLCVILSYDLTRLEGRTMEECVLYTSAYYSQTITVMLFVTGLESEPEQTRPTSRKLQPPSITKPITNTLVVEGNGAKFECQFSGQPQPEIKWLRNGLQVIQDSRNYKVYYYLLYLLLLLLFYFEYRYY
jgi:hypothetical protein